MGTTTPSPDPQHESDRHREQERIAATVTALQGDLARTEVKASLLLALTGAALVGLVSAAGDLELSVPATVAAALGAVALLAATVLLLIAVRPDLGGGGWTSWPGLDDARLRAELTSGYRVDHLRFMAQLATRKFRLIRAAVDCTLAGIGLFALAAVLAWAA
ncbi:hypothetical protein K378_05121 [Streptomyces sp. Amel2xB2]|uniref:Pycsar system effector family protein n=1 Tax=Streptomyces sp. Amel2xB2 TaxID=1305829 RepID=UPI000DBA0EED|nr:Pycsar system effector family protein [Streptomyces sp. Amel2xB2]RAJ58887.1 hypothetical protein K378_05121 [Streptomyces sp. Amel2xB2]